MKKTMLLTVPIVRFVSIVIVAFLYLSGIVLGTIETPLQIIAFICLLTCPFIFVFTMPVWKLDPVKE